MTTTHDGQLTPLVSSAFLRWLEARIDVPDDREHLEVQAPFTLDVIGEIPQATPDDVAAAVARARSAQKHWARTPIGDRAKILSRFHDLVIENADLAMDLVQLEAGKARTPALEEVYDAAATARYYVNVGPGLLRRKRRAVSIPFFTKAWEYHHPVGVVGFIVPWNFSFTLGISDALPALLAGNAAVIKPDEKTPYGTLLAVRLLEEAGLPDGLVQVVTGAGEPIGPSLIDEVDYIMFTGSTAVGRLVAEQAGRQLKGSSMELGGKNSAIVLEDADFSVTIPGLIRGVYANSAQICIGMERIQVHESRYEEFVSAYVDRVRKLPMTSEYAFTSALGALIDEQHMNGVHAHVEDAVEQGARLETGGKPRPDVGPLFYEPTVLTGVDESMAVCRGETFGPVVAIYPFSTEEEAIEEANNSELGLNFSVWTRDEARGVAVAEQLEAGTVGVNDAYAATWSSYDAPMGGMKSSGFGRRHGASGILKFTELQTVASQRLVPAFAPPPGMSYDTYSKVLGPLLKLLKRLPFYK